RPSGLRAGPVARREDGIRVVARARPGGNAKSREGPPTGPASVPAKVVVRLRSRETERATAGQVRVRSRETERATAGQVRVRSREAQRATAGHRPPPPPTNRP